MFTQVINIPEQGAFSQAVTGSTGWVRNPRTSRAVTGTELNTLRFNASLFEVFQIKEATPAMRVTGREKVGDRETFLRRADGPAPAPPDHQRDGAAARPRAD